MNPYDDWKLRLITIQKRRRTEDMKTSSDIVENAKSVFNGYQRKFIQAPDTTFDTFCIGHGTVFPDKRWNHVKTLLDKIYFSETKVQERNRYPTDEEKYVMNSSDPETRPLILKCLLEFGQYEKFLQYAGEELQPVVYEPKRALILSNPDKNYQDDMHSQNTYLTHAIIGSRRYGIPSLKLVRKCVRAFRGHLHFIVCLDALYGNNGTYPMQDKTRLEWLMLFRYFFAPTRFPENVTIHEHVQEIKMSLGNKNIIVHIPDLEEFLYVVTHFFAPEPLPDGLIEALQTGHDSLYL